MAKQDRPGPTPGKGPKQPAARAPVQTAVGAQPAGPAGDKAEPPEVRALREASAGLQYPISESDAPFDVFRWPAGQGGGTTAREQVAAKAGAGRAVDEVPVDRFFAQLDGAEDAGRFRQLRRVAEAQLSGLQVFRAAGTNAKVDVYLIGRTGTGEWAGLHATSVET